MTFSASKILKVKGIGENNIVIQVTNTVKIKDQ